VADLRACAKDGKSMASGDGLTLAAKERAQA
jgi:hypothetical protein